MPEARLVRQRLRLITGIRTAPKACRMESRPSSDCGLTMSQVTRMSSSQLRRRQPDRMTLPRSCSGLSCQPMAGRAIPQKGLDL